MKMLIGLFALSLSLGSIASTGESKTFVYDGSQNSVELLLNGEKTHTEYRTEQRNSTCYRTQVIGYRTICTNSSDNKDFPPPYPHPRPGPGPGPRPGPYPHPHPGPGPGPRPGPYPYPGPYPRRCWQEPIYGQVPYSCVETVSIPYEVKDYDVSARVIVDVRKIGSQTQSVESFTVSLNGEDLSLTTQGSKKFFIVQKQKDIRPSLNGSVKFLDGLYALELVEAAPVLAALDLGDLSYDHGVLAFGLPAGASLQNVGIALNVEKRPIFGSNTTLLDRELAPSEVQLTGTSANVDLAKVGVNLDGGRYGLTPKLFFKTQGTLLNKGDFGDLETSRTLLLKL